MRVIISLMTQTIAAIAKSFVNLVYPLRCAYCNKGLGPMDDAPVCGFCRSQIRPNPRQYGKEGFHFDSAYAACLYEGVLKKLIHQYKYRAKLNLAPFLSGLMADFLNDNDEAISGIDMITFVPLQPGRLKGRGFNQSRELALNISRPFDIAFSDTLEKAVSTRHQNELTRSERLVNVRGAFRLRRGADAAGKRILVIDDVMTTGATFSEAGRALKEAGAAEVRCLALARGA